ncbi:MAG: DUF4402 domain-containing protein [Gammaproteobacteria bacterium]
MSEVFSHSRIFCRHCCGRLLLLSLGLLVQLPMQAATETATVTANVISTLSLTNQSGLAFGDIAASNVAGSVVLSPNGSRISTGGASINSTVAGGPAVFDVQGDPNAVYAVTLPVSVVLSTVGGNTMSVENFTSLPAATGLTDSGGQQTLFVGGTLNVGNNQGFGSYTGIMSVTVDYN